MTNSPLPHFVYELIDAEGNYLYIGVTRDPGQRLGNHRSQQPWWSEVAQIEMHRHADERTGRDAERELIEMYAPKYNSVFTDKHDAGGWTSRRKRQAEAHDSGDLCFETFCQPCREKAHGWRVRCAHRGCSDCYDRPHFFTVLEAHERNDGTYVELDLRPVTRRRRAQAS